MPVQLPEMPVQADECHSLQPVPVVEEASMDLQAALTLREAGLREWESLGKDGQQALRHFLLNTLFRCATAISQEWKAF